MMYTVIKEFVDLKDNRHRYMVGDKYPHHDVMVSDDRIKELSGRNNMLRTPLIQEDTKEAFSLPREGVLETKADVSPTSQSKAKGRPRRKQDKNARTSS